MKRRLSSDTRNVSAFHARVDGKPRCGTKRKWGSLLTDKLEDVSCRRCRALLGLPLRFMTVVYPELPSDSSPILAWPKECCKNVGTDGFVACGEEAVAWYKHGDDICSYCTDHDYACGDKLNGPYDLLSVGPTEKK